MEVSTDGYLYYPKIDSVFKRAEDGSKKLMPGVYQDETVRYLSGLNWTMTEKIDGMNTIVHWNGHSAVFGGRTAKTQIPNGLMKYLNTTFDNSVMVEMFEQIFHEKPVTLYGEGYGGNIQGDKKYRPDPSFILFDVYIGGLWLKRSDVEDIGKKLGIDVVPVILRGTIEEGVKYMLSDPAPRSTFGEAKMEGLVARPEVDLLDRQGKRVVVKIKRKDFINEK